jgi:hypothetical protein
VLKVPNVALRARKFTAIIEKGLFQQPQPEGELRLLAQNGWHICLETVHETDAETQKPQGLERAQARHLGLGKNGPKLKLKWPPNLVFRTPLK